MLYWWALRYLRRLFQIGFRKGEAKTSFQKLAMYDRMQGSMLEPVVAWASEGLERKMTWD